MRKTIWLVLVAMLAVGLIAAVAAGCGNTITTTTSASGTVTTAGPTTTAANTPTTAAGAPVTGGVAQIGTLSHPAKFGYPGHVFGPDQFFEGLFLEMMVNPTDKIDVYTPALAESWDLAPDKLSYTFHLRQGVKFADGTDFNADACKFCWDLNLAPAPAAGGATTTTAAAPPTTAAAGPPGPPPGPPPDFAFVKSIEVVDANTVKVNLNQWTNQALNFIGRKSWAVFSPTAYKDKGADYMDTHPVGTGAFMLTSFTPDQEMVLAKNPNYWGKDANGLQLPYMDGVDFKVFGDPTTMLVALQAGQLDGTDQVDLVGAQKLQSDSKYVLGNFAGPVLMLEMNTTDPASVWSDIKMRQALEYAIDKEGISKSVGMGFEPPVYEVLHSLHEIVDPGTTPRTYDPAKAKSLMAEAGHPAVSFTLSYDTSRTEPGMGEAIQANLAAVGITVKLNGMNTGAFSAISTKVPQGNDMIFQGERGGAPNVLAGATEMFAKGTIYFPAFTPPAQFYTLMAQAQTHDKLADAIPDLAQMEKIAYDDAQVCPITTAAFISVTGPKLKNMVWTLGNTPTPWFNEAWLVK